MSRPRLSYLPARVQGAPSRSASAVAVGSWRVGKETTTARGYGYKWQKYRERFLEAHPLCEKCRGLGLVTAATVVDHIVPHQGDQVRFWDASNHQALCRPCHDQIKAGEERAAGYR